jgi:hypothetical protein
VDKMRLASLLFASLRGAHEQIHLSRCIRQTSKTLVSATDHANNSYHSHAVILMGISESIASSASVNCHSQDTYPPPKHVWR